MYQKHMIENCCLGLVGGLVEFESTTTWATIKCSNQLSYSHMASLERLELPTHWLQISSSTNWAMPAYYLNFKGRWRWGFTDSYSCRFQTAYPYFSDFTPAGTNPALSDPFKVYCHVSKTRRFSRQLFPLGGLRTVYLGISTTNRFLCRHSIS